MGAFIPRVGCAREPVLAELPFHGQVPLGDLGHFVIELEGAVNGNGKRERRLRTRHRRSVLLREGIGNNA